MESDITTVEIEYTDGTKARWALEPDDDRIDDVSDAIELVIGPPDTLLT